MLLYKILTVGTLLSLHACHGSKYNVLSGSVPVANSAETEFGLPVAEIYVTEDRSTGSLRLITNVSDSEVVIRNDLIMNGTFYNQIVLFCNASYPVEWIYEGDGAPRLHTGQFRTYKVFSNPATYEYSAVIALYQERYNEEQTGTYVCRSIDDSRLQVFYHLYFPGEFGFPALRNRVIRPSKGATFVTLPCKATDPQARMSLLKIYPKKESANLTDGKYVTFDPRDGFQLNLLELNNPYGTYICEANGLPSFWKIELVPTKDDEVVYWPSSNRVSLTAFQNHTFKCRAKEPVTIVVPTSYTIGNAELSTNETHKFPYKATFTLKSPIPLSSIGNYFKVNCVTKREMRVLHTWHYSNIESERITVSYDKEQRRMLCCTNLELSPTYEFAPCETLTDCAITKHCFKGSHCRPAVFPAPRIVDAPKGCVAAQFPNNIQTHVMRCAVGDRAEPHYILESLEKDQIIIWNGKLPPADKILKAQVLTFRANLIRLQCTGKAFFFSLNYVFVIERLDGSMEFVKEGTIQDVRTHSPILTRTIDSTVKRIYCFAPLTRSPGWMNSYVDINTPESPYKVAKEL